jgi:hypothetical protein
MAHESILSNTVNPAVAGVIIQEGRLVQLVASGLKADLPTALLAASGTRLNVFVAFAAPDNFSRPTPGALYSAGSTSQYYENGTWSNFTETDTFYRMGLSTLENPILASGYSLLAKLGGVYTVPSGCVIDSAALRVVGALAKVSDDGTGRFEVTTNETVVVARVRDFDPSLLNYTFETVLS